MKTGEPTLVELGHLVAVRALVEGRDWNDPEDAQRIEAGLVQILRLSDAVNRRGRKSRRDLELKKEKGIR